MIDPRDQWAIQIDVTNVCGRACSNCTRLVGHGEPFFMSDEQFATALDAVSGFPDSHDGFSLVGLIGGEPLLHPNFSGLLDIMVERIPNRAHRGLWTGVDLESSQYREQIKDVFLPSGIHNNRHDLTSSRHSPVLVASMDVVADPHERSALVDHCWLQSSWCSTVTPKGYFFCEVAGALDWVFHGPGGLPVKPECWKRPLSDFRDQIDRWCQRCGIALNLQGRPDKEEVDDISETNLRELAASARVQRGQVCEYAPSSLQTINSPWAYKQDGAS